MKLDGIPRDLVDELDKASARLSRLERRPRGLTVGEVPTSVSTYAQDDPPPEPLTVGSLWVDTDDDDKIYRWDGVAWILVRDAGVTQAQALAAVLMVGAMDVFGAADNLVTTFYTDVAPSGALSIGDLWADFGGGSLFRWSGTVWVDQANTEVTAALADPGNVKALADGHIKTWWQFDPPTAEGLGDLWVDTNDGDKIYRWSGTRWVSVLSVGIDDLHDIVDGKITTFYLPSTTPPTATAIGDLWVVTDMDNLIRRWNGTVWVDVEIGDLGLASLGVGKLLAGTLQVLIELTTGGRIVAGDEAGAHVIMDGDGLRAYTDATTEMVGISSTGEAHFGGTVHSTDFVEGLTGWEFSSEESQVSNLNVLNEVGAQLVTCQSLLVNGVDLTNAPQGLVVSTSMGGGGRVDSVSINNTSGEVMFVQVAAGTLLGARAYTLGYSLTLAQSGSANNTSFLAQVRVTTDGSKPNLTSPIVDGASIRIAQNASATASGSVVIPWTVPGGSDAEVRFGLTVQWIAGAGATRVLLSSANDKMKFFVNDVGALQESLGAIAQMNKLGNPIDDPDPTADFTAHWSPTWGQSYNGDTTRYTLAGNDLYQGVKPDADTHGNTRSLLGFDYNAIADQLTGTTITDVRLTFRVKGTALNSGANLQIGTHVQASILTAPTTWLAGQVTAQRTTRLSVKSGGTYKAVLPVAIGNDFRSGAARGIAFGPGADASALQRCLLYGVGSGSAPVLSISYRV